MTLPEMARGSSSDSLPSLQLNVVLIDETLISMKYLALLILSSILSFHQLTDWLMSTAMLLFLWNVLARCSTNHSHGAASGAVADVPEQVNAVHIMFIVSVV